MNVLARYREGQARVRELFDPFTRAHCPTCPTPCCVKPTRVRPVDIILVEELTGSRRGAPARALLEDGAGTLLDRGGPPAPSGPCDHLTAAGCSFPHDLRPFGCVAFVCEPMRRLLPPEELARIETAVAELAAIHADLMAALQ